MKIGRNNVCPCGSGKKYKKCCLKKDLSERHQQQTARELESEEAADSATSDLRGRNSSFQSADSEEEPSEAESAGREVEPELDPREEAVGARWDEFEAADYQRRIELFTQALDEPDTMEDLAYEMLSAINKEANDRNECDRFEILVRALQERLPDVYRRDAPYLIPPLIGSAVARGHWDKITPWAREMAAYADNIDMFNHVLDPLAYHGQLATLVEMMRIGWPLVRESGDVLPLGIREFVDRAVRFEMLFYFEQTETPHRGDPELIRRLEFYVQSIDRESVDQFIKHLIIGAEKAGVPSGAGDGPAEQKSSDEDEAAGSKSARAEWCELLCVEFLAYLYREEDVPYSKADLAGASLAQYLLGRLRRHAASGMNLYDPGRRPKQRKGKQRYKQRRAFHVLCPDKTTLESHLAEMSGFIESHYHRMAATWEIVPAWLRFLESRQLIDNEEHTRTLNDLGSLRDDILRLWKNFGEDPALYEGVKQAWGRVEVEVAAELEVT